jgi:hypothetical protein
MCGSSWQTVHAWVRRKVAHYLETGNENSTARNESMKCLYTRPSYHSDGHTNPGQLSLKNTHAHFNFGQRL